MSLYFPLAIIAAVTIWIAIAVSFIAALGFLAVMITAIVAGLLLGLLLLARLWSRYDG